MMCQPLVALAVASLIVGSVSGPAHGQSAPVPDFSGVYYPITANAGRGGGARAGGPAARGALPPPTRSAPTSDGRNGRTATSPKLTPEYLARWEVMRQSRMAGSSEFDPAARCLSAGMPSMMAMTYGMEIMQTRDRITIYGELNDMYRRIFLDGRRPSQKVLDDPTYAGYSTGRWEGDTLVVDTVAIREDTLLDTFSPHSDRMTVRERLRFVEPGLLEDQITVTDPVALIEPHVMTRRYRRAAPPNDELREFSCAEGLADAK